MIYRRKYEKICFHSFHSSDRHNRWILNLIVDPFQGCFNLFFIFFRKFESNYKVFVLLVGSSVTFASSLRFEQIIDYLVFLLSLPIFDSKLIEFLQLIIDYLVFQSLNLTLSISISFEGFEYMCMYVISFPFEGFAFEI